MENAAYEVKNILVSQKNIKKKKKKKKKKNLNSVHLSPLLTLFQVLCTHSGYFDIYSFSWFTTS